MGLFDYVHIPRHMLPLEDEEKALFPEIVKCQTKDLESHEHEYFITNDGDVLLKEFKTEVVPANERPYPDPNHPFHIFGCFKQVDTEPDVIYFEDSEVHIYIYIGDICFEFDAYFENGVLDKILRRSKKITMEWISVDDYLPEVDTEVVVFIKDYVDISSIRCIRIYGDSIIVEWTEQDYGSINPTHWMPLPEPPK